MTGFLEKMTGFLYPGYVIVETFERVPEIDISLCTRFRGRAERRRDKLNAEKEVPFYRWEVTFLHDRWCVVALQNKLEKINRGSQTTSGSSSSTTE